MSYAESLDLTDDALLEMSEQQKEEYAHQAKQQKKK
jgi:hypothetical protein